MKDQYHLSTDTFAIHEKQDMKELLRAIDQEAKAPQDDDQIMAACYRVTARLLREGDPAGLAGLVDTAFEFRSELGRYLKPLAKANLLFRAIHDNRIRTDPEYPNTTYETEEKWEQAYKELLVAGNMEPELYMGNLVYNTIQSNPLGRYSTHKLILLTEPERFSEPSETSFLDVGFSAGVDLKNLALGMPRDEIDVVAKNRQNIVATHPAMKRLVNKVLETPFFLEGYVAIEPYPVNKDAAYKQWAFGNSHRPKEMYDKERMQAWWRAANANIEGEHFLQGEFDHETMQASPIDKFKMISMTTVLYLQGDKDRADMIALTDEYLEDDGIAVIQDFAYPVRGGAALNILKKWNPKVFPYRTFVKFKDDPKLHCVFMYETGRCKKMKLGKDAKVLNLGKQLLALV